MGRPVIAVHGGAGAWRGLDFDYKLVYDAIEESIVRGLEASRTGNCIDMIVESIAYLEDSGLFNAGVGSTLDYIGNVLMDAGLMTSYGKAAGVASVSYPRNPIRLARLILEKTPHVIISGPWADDIARRFSLEKHPGPSIRAQAMWRDLKSGKIESPWVKARIESAKTLGYDTVGAVALDSSGCLAAGASTGGVALKLPGRVGDSPIPGAGFYADSNIAVSATGIGETIILSMTSLRVANLYATLGILDNTLRIIVEEHTRRWGPGTLGLIALSFKGEISGYYNTEAMPWGYARLGEEIRILGLNV
ncbi:MAG: isoaspartyl peptidase/L-asparaginase [Acidilobaceae archaeon]